MSGYVWQWPRPVVEHKPARDTRTFATHLRGKNTVSRNGLWIMRVVNTATGEVVTSDNGCVGLDRAFEHTEFYTAAARAAWMAGVKQSSLSRVSGRRAS